MLINCILQCGTGGRECDNNLDILECFAGEKILIINRLLQCDRGGTICGDKLDFAERYRRKRE